MKNTIKENFEYGFKKLKEPFFLSQLKKGGVLLYVKGVSKGIECSNYIFQSSNGNIYYFCPEALKTPKDFGGEYKSFKDFPKEGKVKYAQAISNKAYYVKVKKIESSSEYDEEPIINNKSQLHIQFNVDGKNKFMYKDLPSNIDKVLEYGLSTSMGPLENIIDDVQLIADCNKYNFDEEDDLNSSPTKEINKYTDKEDRENILKSLKNDNDRVTYITQNDDEITIAKGQHGLLCFIDDDSTPKPCQFGDNGNLLVLIQ